MTQRELQEQYELAVQLSALGFRPPDTMGTVGLRTILELLEPHPITVAEAHALGVDLSC